jgi:hypothetical protein
MFDAVTLTFSNKSDFTAYIIAPAMIAHDITITTIIISITVAAFAGLNSFCLSISQTSSVY